MAAGKFITFEGGEGSGKSTQAKLFAERLSSRGKDVVMTREPGGSPFAEQVRALILSSETAAHSALSEALLFYAARADHLDRTVRPALAAGRWVVCDRFSDSTRVYQGYAGTLPKATIDALEHLVVAPTEPDLTIVLDIDPAIGLSRAELRRTGNEVDRSGAADRYESRTMAYHEKLRQGFLDIARRNPQRCVVVPAMGEPQRIAEIIWDAASARLPSGDC